MAKDNTYKKENAFLVLAKRMSRNKNAMFGLTLFGDPGSGDYHCPDRFSVSV